MFIGPPGSGKGTQAVRVAGQLSIPHISTGDLLRAAVKAESPLGRAVAATLATGALVSDQVMTDLVGDRLQAGDTARGFILDGFPRTGAQARALDTMRPPETLLVIHIAVGDDALVRRLSSRRVCDSCAITQSVAPAEAAAHEMCPYCGGNLVRRPDDDPETVRRRLVTYASAAAPVLDLYRSRHGFITIDGSRHADAVTADILAFVKSCGRS